MKFQIMDQTGHSEQVFDKADVVSMDDAMKRFEELTAKGYRAAKPGQGGNPGALMKGFDPAAESVLFIPALQGG
jgi:hypothetical protein